MKRQATDYEKILAKLISVKGFLSRIYKEISKSNSKITIQLESRHFTREDIRMANKHLKSRSASLVIREMQIKSTRYYSTPNATNKSKRKIL